MHFSPFPLISARQFLHIFLKYAQRIKMNHVSYMCDDMQSQNIVKKLLIYVVNSYGSARQLHFKVQKPTILIEFFKNTFTMCFPQPSFPIPKSTIICEKVKKVILTFQNPFDHCTLMLHVKVFDNSAVVVFCLLKRPINQKN